MALTAIENTAHTSVKVVVSELQYEVQGYDKFVLRFLQNGNQILAYQKNHDTSTAHSFSLTFANDVNLGNNWFAPSTSYNLIIDCYVSGTAYPLQQISFTTDSISPPSITINPSVYPMIKDQGANGNCVAMSLSTAMEIFKAKAMGSSNSYENFSVSYIFGSDGMTYDFMMFGEAVDLCSIYGSSRWELVTTRFPDSTSKADSVNLFNGASTVAKENAKKQKFTGSANIDFYDCASVASAIQTYGYFMMNFRVPYNFYTIPSDGIVPQPSNGYSYYNHSLALIGLTTINNKKHWIAQNSWGTSWGKNGLCYVPFDWGCGVQSPQGSNNTNDVCGWTADCYSVWNNNISTIHPQNATLTSFTRNGVDVTVNWNFGTSGSYIQLYGRKQGTIDWFPKPSYGTLYSTNNATISFTSDTDTYEIMALAIIDYLVSFQSNILVVGGISVLPWDWTSSTDRQKAYNALINKGVTSDFSYLVWNELVNKIFEVDQAIGVGWDESYATLTQTTMLSTDKVMTAKRFNSAKYNVGVHYSTGIPDVNIGSTMLGSNFTALTTKLNQWIDTL